MYAPVSSDHTVPLGGRPRGFEDDFAGISFACTHRSAHRRGKGRQTARSKLTLPYWYVVAVPTWHHLAARRGQQLTLSLDLEGLQL